jgi:hypothetical protein
VINLAALSKPHSQTNPTNPLLKMKGNKIAHRAAKLAAFAVMP